MSEENKLEKLSDDYGDFKNKVFYRIGEIMERIEKIEKQLNLTPRERGLLGKALMED